MRSKVGIGLIGCGGFARMIAEAVRGLPEMRVVALVDEIRDKAQSLKEAYGFTDARVSGDRGDVLEKPDISAVAIATPPYLHEELCFAAISSGKAVFCEKPGALSAASALEIARAAERRTVAAAVDLVMRQNPLCLALKTIIEDRILGDIERLEIENYAHDERLPTGHWFWDKKKSGGIWIEHGVHFFDLVNWVLDQTAPEWIWASGFLRERPADARGVAWTDIEDRVIAVAWYPRGTIVSFYHGFKRPERYERTVTRVVGSKGYGTLYGWMPMKLEVEAFPDFADTALSRKLLSEAADLVRTYLQNLEPSEGQNLQLVSAVEVSHIGGGCVRGSYELGPDRRMVYAGCVRAGLRDLMRAAPPNRPAADFTTVSRALAVAEAAEASYRKMQRLYIDRGDL